MFLGSQVKPISFHCVILEDKVLFFYAKKILLKGKQNNIVSLVANNSGIRLLKNIYHDIIIQCTL